MSRFDYSSFRVGSHGLLPFDQFPWFKQATIKQITNVERPVPDHLYWPSLDVDLSVDSIRRPEQFPLMARG